jgi:predicted Fe-Mo cluster-binding NifX family protein
MIRKLLIPLYRNEVAPRFDLAAEVFLVTLDDRGKRIEERTVVLPQPSSEQLCNFILREAVHVVVCGGIEEEYYQYLIWKKVDVLDSVIGTFEAVVESFIKGALQAGDILYDRSGTESNLGNSGIADV